MMRPSTSSMYPSLANNLAPSCSFSSPVVANKRIVPSFKASSSLSSISEMTSAARPPFISLVPLPYNFPSFSVSSNGGYVHSFSSPLATTSI